MIISKIGIMGETELSQDIFFNPRLDIWSSLSFNVIKRSSFDIFFWLWRAILIWVSPKFQVYVFSCLAFDHGLCGVFCALSLYAVSRSTKLFKWDLDATKIQLLVYNRVS